MNADMDRFSGKYEPVTESGCWLWLAGNGNFGYGAFWLAGRTIYAHRASWILHKGAIPAAAHICHTCDTPSCVNPAHLFLGNAADNMADKVAKGRQATGHAHGLSKLTEADAVAIFLDKGNQKALAERYGVNKSQVSKIQQRATWVHATAHLPANGSRNPRRPAHNRRIAA